MLKRLSFISFFCLIILLCIFSLSGCQNNASNLFEFDLLIDDTYSIKSIKDNDITSIEIPSTYKGKAIKSIGRNAFEDCTKLTNIVISEGIEIIESYAFKGCSNLVKIVLPNTVKKIGTDAFDGCNALEYNEYKNGNYLGNSDNKYIAFINGIDKNVTYFEINDNCNVIYANALTGFSYMKSIEMPHTIKYIGESAFSYCTSLETFEIPNLVEDFDSSWFNFCSALKTITLSANIETLSISYMYGCNSFVEFNVYSTNSMYTAENGVLYSKDGKTLIAYPIAKADENFKIPSYVETIATYAFNGCLNLKSLTMWGTVRSLEQSCVINCDSLNTLNFNGTMNEWISLDNANLGWDNSFSVNRVICSDGVLNSHKAY